MVAPVGTLRIDWDNDGNFTGPFDTVNALVDESNRVVVKRGASADFSGEATGEQTFVLENNDNAYSVDRNWADNPSFEVNTTGWSLLAITSLTAAATSITQVVDNAGQGGTKAGEAVLTATLNSGATFPIPYRFLNGITYSFTIWLKSISGNLNVRAGLASAGTPTDIGSTGANITAAWVAYSGTFTPTADRTDVVIFVRTTTAAAATLRIDAVQVNPGAASNTYLEAPTRGQLIPGRPVHFYETSSAVDYPKFYGQIQRITPKPEDRTVEVTCHDVLATLSDTGVVFNAGPRAVSARECRLGILESFERGNRNLIANPSFEVNTTGWVVSAGAVTRVAGDFAPNVGGTACGQFAAVGAGNQLTYDSKLTPVFLAGETYRASVYLRCTAGTQTWQIGALDTGTPGTPPYRTVTVTTTWQRFTVTCLGAGTPASSGTVRFYLVATGANTVRLDAAALTRGQALYPYADVGTGRWPNFMGNGSFDGNDTRGWQNAWTNLITNPSFEVNITGWSTAASGFLAVGDVLTRDVVTPKFGVASGAVADGGGAVANKGVEFAITGTFLAGVTYTASLWLRQDAGVAQTFQVGIGSNGTPADLATVSQLGTAAFALFSVTWTPSVNRADARLFARIPGVVGPGFHVDGAFVAAMGTYGPYPYADVGPAAGGVPATSIATSSTTPKYGSRSLTAVLPATTGAGVAYDFYHCGSLFQLGQQFTLSLWLNVAAGTFPFKVGLSANKGDGTFDEVTATGTVTAGVWQQVTLSWTPAADRSAVGAAGGGGGVWLTIYQTNATARTIFVDGIRLIPGNAADAFEMTQWIVPTAAEGDIYSSASFSGTALSALATLNGLTLSRHWIRPKMASPWYEYVIEDRDSFLVKAVAETLTENVETIENLDFDRDSIINIVTVTFGANLSESYSDEASIAAYGPIPGTTINGSSYFPDRTIPDIIGPAVIARYKNGVLRPVVTVHNEYPTQLVRDLADLFDLNVDRFLTRHAQFVILTEELTIGQSSRDHLTRYQLEAYPF